MKKLHHAVLDVRHFDRVQFREEVRQSIIPFAVVNMVRLRVHKVVNLHVFWMTPSVGSLNVDGTGFALVFS